MAGRSRGRGTGDWAGTGSLDASSLAATVPGLTATTQPGSWRRGGAQLLLGEAFITAAGKPEPLPAGQHAADAAAAGLALVELLDSPGTHLRRALLTAGVIQLADGDGTVGRAADWAR